MKFILALVLAITPHLAFGSRTIEADFIKSSDRTKTWTFPSITDPLCGITDTQTLTNKSISGGQITSAVATATALAANPSDCASDTYATTIAASGNLTCASITNAATTATASNTNSTIVLRDGSGNFAATTITAALTGNASTATALAANPADCSANQFATTIAASGALTCAALTTADLPAVTVWASGSTPLINWASVTPTSAGACTVNAQSGSWITSTTPNAAGDCTLNFSGIWSAAPFCVITMLPGDTSQSNAYTTRVHSASTTAMRFLTQVNTGTIGENHNASSIICIGPR